MSSPSPSRTSLEELLMAYRREHERKESQLHSKRVEATSLTGHYKEIYVNVLRSQIGR
jgi:hypothetical protein